MTRLVWDRVTLRPFREDEVNVVLRFVPPWAVGDGDGRAKREEALTMIGSSGSWSRGRLDLGIESEGRLVGAIQARSTNGALPPGVYELGVELFEAIDRGHGLGGGAVVAMTRFLFDERGAIRVQLSTDVDNGAMRRVAERLGFGHEGTMRGFMPGEDGPRDYAMYAMTASDYETRGHAWTSTS